MIRLQSRILSFPLAFALLAVLFVGAPLFAQPIERLDTNDNWTTGTAWNGGVAPGPTDAVSFEFAGSGGNLTTTRTTTIDQPLITFGNAIDTSTFNSAADATGYVYFDLAGNTLQHNAGSTLDMDGVIGYFFGGGSFVNSGNITSIPNRLEIAPGTTFRNEGNIDFFSDYASNRWLARTGGTFINEGTANSLQSNYLLLYQGGDFINEEGALFTIQGGSNDYLAGYRLGLHDLINRGVVRVDTGVMGGVQGLRVYDSLSHLNIENTGKFEVMPGSEFNITNNGGTLDVSQWATATSLTNGSIHVHDDARFDFTTLAAGAITTIGPNASVHLGGPNADFPQLGTVTSLQGGLFFHGGLDPVGAGVLPSLNITSGTIGGSTLPGPVTIGAGATIQPEGINAIGGEIASLSIAGDLTLQDAARIALDISDPSGGPGVGFDFLDVAGTLDLPAGGSVELALEGPDGAIGAGSSIPFAQADQINNFDSTEFDILFDPSLLGPGFGSESPLSVSQIGDQLFLNNNLTTPEPSTFALGSMLLFGGAFTWWWRRRRG